jgi:hypothetical protein
MKLSFLCSVSEYFGNMSNITVGQQLNSLLSVTGRPQGKPLFIYVDPVVKVERHLLILMPVL